MSKEKKMILGAMVLLAVSLYFSLRSLGELVDGAQKEYYSPGAERARFVEECVLAGISFEECTENGFKMYPDDAVE